MKRHRSRAEVITSRTPEQQVENLKTYFNAFLTEWCESILTGVRPMEGNQEKILGELALALATHSAAAVLSMPGQPDETIEADCNAMALDYVSRLIEKAHARHGGHTA